MASLMSLLTGHRPGAFEGFKMKDLFDKDRWNREQRTWSGQRTPTGPNDIRTNRAGEPMMTNWYRGRGTPEANVIKTRDAGGAPIYQGPQQQDNAKIFPLRPSPRVEARALSDPSDSGARWSGGAALLPERVQTRETVAPGTLSIGPEYNRPPPNYIQRTLDTGIPGYFGNPNADTVATEEEVEAMNAYRNQMLTDLLAETSEEPEVKAISYYKKKKKRSPKTYRSQSRGYRLKRI